MLKPAACWLQPVWQALGCCCCCCCCYCYCCCKQMASCSRPTGWPGKVLDIVNSKWLLPTMFLAAHATSLCSSSVYSHPVPCHPVARSQSCCRVVLTVYAVVIRAVGPHLTGSQANKRRLWYPHHTPSLPSPSPLLHLNPQPPSDHSGSGITQRTHKSFTPSQDIGHHVQYQGKQPIFPQF